MGRQLRGVVRRIKDVEGILQHAISLDRPWLETRYNSRQLTGDDEVHEVRRFATQCFVDLGKINPSEVGNDGILTHDSLLPLSTFFGSYRNGELQATARLIWRDGCTVDDLRLPLDQINHNQAQSLRDVDQHQPGAIAEIGSMAKVKGAPSVANLELLHSMWRFAVDNDIKSFVCGLDPKIYPWFRAMFGNALQPLSDGPVDSPDTVEFPGIIGPQVPLLIDVNRAIADQETTEGRFVTKPLMRTIGRIITRDLNLKNTTDNSLQNPPAKSY